MTDVDSQSNGRSGRRPAVSDVVAVSGRGEGFVYRPREVLLRRFGVDRLLELPGRSEMNVRSVSDPRGNGESEDGGSQPKWTVNSTRSTCSSPRGSTRSRTM